MKNNNKYHYHHHHHHYYYKIYIIVFILFHFVLITKSQTTQSLPTHIKLYHFKNNRNSDFGIQLPTQIQTPDIANNRLVNSLPEYCCGNVSKYSTSDPSLLIVHNETTFNQWWQLSIDDNNYCRNYELVIPIDVSNPDDNTVQFQVFHNTHLADKGFNNITEFPQYENDTETDLYCWSISLDLIPILGEYKEIKFSSSEIWVFIDDQLVFDFGGIGYSDTQLLYTLPDRELNIQIFKCNRDNYQWDDLVNISGYNISCLVDDICGTCGESWCEAKECLDNITSCGESKVICGSCIIDQQRNCDDNDICTTDSCSEGIGCTHIEIQDCYCSSENCYTDDLCFPKYCLDNHTCHTEPVICQGNSTCLDPECEFGECKCSAHKPVTLSSSTTSTISTISTTYTITSTNSISSTFTTTQSSLSTIDSTISPTIKSYECNQFSCPTGYCCVNLYKSYTCLSKYFQENCNNDNILNQFY